MRKLFLLSLLLLSSLCIAQTGQTASTIQYIASAAAGPVANSGINQQTLGKVHQLSWAVTGTVSTCTVAIDTSADGVTWSAGGLLAGQTCTSNGQSVSTIGNANYVRINVTVLSGTGSVTLIYSYWAGAADPCGANWIPKNSTFANITTATTTNLVTAVAGQSVYVCSLFVTQEGTTTNNTFLLEYGTGAGCSSPTVITTTLSGQGTTGLIPANFLLTNPLKATPVGTQLCGVSTVATAPTIGVQVNYVQM